MNCASNQTNKPSPEPPSEHSSEPSHSPEASTETSADPATPPPANGAADSAANGAANSAAKALTDGAANGITDGPAETTSSRDCGGLELVAGLSAQDLERCLLQANRHTEVGNRLLAFYLNDMQVRGIHQLYGYRSAVHYAVERLDMHRRRAQMLVAVGSALLTLRGIDEALARGELSWSKTRLLCRVATEETEREWLAKAMELSCRELEWLVKSCGPGDRPSLGRHGGGLPKVRFHVHAELGALDHEIWEQAKEKLARERGVPVSDAELMAELSRMLLSTKADGSIPGRKPVEDSWFRVVVDPGSRTVQTRDGAVPLSDVEVETAVSDGHPTICRTTRNKVLDRDGRRCRCCRSSRNLQVHHVRFVSQGGEARPENLLTLCSHCHSRVHEGLMRVRRTSQGEVEFQDRRGRSLRGALPFRLQSSARERVSAGGVSAGERVSVRRQEVDCRIRPLEGAGRSTGDPAQQLAHRASGRAGPQQPARHGRREQPPWVGRGEALDAREARSHEVQDAAFVRQNLHRLEWRGGRLVFV